MTHGKRKGEEGRKFLLQKNIMTPAFTTKEGGRRKRVKMSPGFWQNGWGKEGEKNKYGQRAEGGGRRPGR